MFTVLCVYAWRVINAQRERERERERDCILFLFGSQPKAGLVYRYNHYYTKPKTKKPNLRLEIMD